MPELPYLTFDGRARFGTAHWKLDALEEYAGTRPLAWVDDSLDESCYELGGSAGSAHPARAHRVRPGLLDAHVEAPRSVGQATALQPR